MKFTLGKEERLKSRKRIETLFKESQAVRSPAVLVLYHFPNEVGDKTQAMFTVSKRNFKRAHDRNFIKRYLRESYRLQKHTLTVSRPIHLCFTFTGKQLPEYDYIFKKVGQALLEINKSTQLHEKN